MSLDKNNFDLLTGIVSNIKLSFDKYKLFFNELVQTIIDNNNNIVNIKVMTSNGIPGNKDKSLRKDNT